MEKLIIMKNNQNKFIYWTPRVLSILFIIFLALMSVNTIAQKLGLWQVVFGIFVNNIVAFILLAALIVSWKYEIVGGIAFILAGTLYSVLLARNTFEWYLLAWAGIVPGITFFVGILFLIGWYKKRMPIVDDKNIDNQIL